MTKLGRYDIIDEIGRGGFATVYKARDTQLNRSVALKVLHPGWNSDASFVRRFKQEAETVANFSHPNIVTIYDVGEIERQLFISMEFLPGEDLRRWLERKNAPLSISEVMPILQPLADALDYAHRQGVIHRDIKPGNVMIQEAGADLRVVLTDFGLVKAMTSSVAFTELNQTLGSPEYMAPEQADPNRQDEIGPHTDLYAFGIVTYQMLVGRVPFPGQSISTLNAHANLAVPSPQTLNPDVSDKVSAILLKMLAKQPSDRYPTAVSFVQALQTVSQSAQAAKTQDARTAALYTQLQKAYDAEAWVDVISIASQMEILSPNYKDVAQLLAEARRHLQQPQTTTGSSSKGEVNIEETDLKGAPILQSDPISSNPSFNSTKIGSGSKIPKQVWVIGGIVGVVVIGLLWMMLSSLNENDPAGPTPVIVNVLDWEATETRQANIHVTETAAAAATETRLSNIQVTEAAVTEKAATVTFTPSPTDTPRPTRTPTPDLAAPPANPTLGSRWERPTDGMVMVYVPDGIFMMGSDPDVDPDAEDDEQPQHEVTLTGFWLDQTEVTNAQYTICVDDGTCAASPYANDADFNGDEYPVVGVSWNDAETYCSWAGGQLPTEAQWEYAARGDDGRLYPWGNETPTCNLAQFSDCTDYTMPVGSSSPAGDSWVGAQDMSGNVWEWAADWYDSDTYTSAPETDPIGPLSGISKVLRGGSWFSYAQYLRSAYRSRYDPTYRNADVGFRCAAPGK